MEKAPIFSYVKSRGMYAGVEVVGQVFVERYDENGSFYHWKGVKAGDIVSPLWASVSFTSTEVLIFETLEVPLN